MRLKKKPINTLYDAAIEAASKSYLITLQTSQLNLKISFNHTIFTTPSFLTL